MHGELILMKYFYVEQQMQRLPSIKIIQSVQEQRSKRETVESHPSLQHCQINQDASV